MGNSKPGEFVKFEGLVEEGLVYAEGCPHDVNRFKGGSLTDIATVVSEEQDEE